MSLVRCSFAGPSPPVLLQALYVDENITFDFAPFFVPGDDSFQLPASPSEGGFVQLEQISFQSDASGVWRFSGENLRPGCNTGIDRCSYEARGFNGVWARVPAPPALVLLVVGLVGLGVRPWRRNHRH